MYSSPTYSYSEYTHGTPHYFFTRTHSRRYAPKRRAIDWLMDTAGDSAMLTPPMSPSSVSSMSSIHSSPRFGRRSPYPTPGTGIGRPGLPYLDRLRYVSSDPHPDDLQPCTSSSYLHSRYPTLAPLASRSDSLGIPVSTASRQEREEEGFIDGAGNVVVQKRVTRVVTTTRTVLEGDGEPRTETFQKVYGDDEAGGEFEDRPDSPGYN